MAVGRLLDAVATEGLWLMGPGCVLPGLRLMSSVKVTRLQADACLEGLIVATRLRSSSRSKETEAGRRS